jgi:hypothetical protein
MRAYSMTYVDLRMLRRQKTGKHLRRSPIIPARPRHDVTCDLRWEEGKSIGEPTSHTYPTLEKQGRIRVLSF